MILRLSYFVISSLYTIFLFSMLLLKGFSSWPNSSATGSTLSPIATCWCMTLFDCSTNLWFVWPTLDKNGPNILWIRPPQFLSVSDWFLVNNWTALGLNVWKLPSLFFLSFGFKADTFYFVFPWFSRLIVAQGDIVQKRLQGSEADQRKGRL